MAKRKVNPFKWGPFGRKQLLSIDESHARINVWTGAVRSGKTIASIVRWLTYIREGPAGALLMCGKTERSLYRNVIAEIERIVGSSNCRYMRGTGEVIIYGRTIYVVGANDERSESKIRGLTLAGAYGDEVTLWPEGFFRQLLARLSVEGAAVFLTTNPDSPTHWFKVGFLDKTDLDLRQWHFTLWDNPNLSRKYIDSLIAEYKGSVWEHRSVYGRWVAAEGAIYSMLDAAKHKVAKAPRILQTWVAADYGTTNPCVFLEIGLGEDQRLYVLREYRWDSKAKGRQKTDAEYSADMKQWLSESQYAPQRIWIDPSAASWQVQLWRDGIKVADADNTVMDGIRAVSSLLATGRLLFVAGAAEQTWNEMVGYAWDPKSKEEKPLKTADHGVDALRYAINGTRSTWGRWMRGVA